MATAKQKMAVSLIKEDFRKPLGEVLIQSGYSPSVADKPSIITQSAGFIEEMKNYGLTKELIATSLKEDISEKRGNRSAELNLGAKILRMTDEREAGSDAPVLNIVIAEIRNVNNTAQ